VASSRLLRPQANTGSALSSRVAPGRRCRARHHVSGGVCRLSRALAKRCGRARAGRSHHVAHVPFRRSNDDDDDDDDGDSGVGGYLHRQTLRPQHGVLSKAGLGGRGVGCAG